MQIIIDTREESAASLRLIAAIIQNYGAALQEIDSPQIPLPIPQQPQAPAASNVVPFVNPNPTSTVPTVFAQAGGPSAVVPIVPEGTTVDPNAPSFDAEGLPWDERIHASTKGRNADGTWRIRRGVNPQLVTNVKAELVARVNAGGSAPVLAATAGGAVPLVPSLPPLAQAFQAPGAASVVPGYVTAQPSDGTAQAVAQPVPVPLSVLAGAVGVPQPIPQLQPVQPVVPVPPQQVSTVGNVPAGPRPTTLDDFTPFMKRYNEVAQQRGWDHNVLNRLCQSAGVADANGLCQRPNLIGAVQMTLEEIAAGRMSL